MFVSHCRLNVPLSLVTICHSVRFAHMSGLKPRKRGVMDNATSKASPLGVPGEASCTAGNFSSVSAHTTPPSSTLGEETRTSASPAVKTETSDPARGSAMNRQHGSVRLLKKPVPPWKPEPEDCCGSGCERCIFDMYYEQLEEYEEALKRWDVQQRQLGQTGDDTSSPK